jgi:uncharacterized protein (TIRG00374 family)
MSRPASRGADDPAVARDEDHAGAAAAVDDSPHRRLDISRRSVVIFVVFLALAIVALYVLLPQVAGLEETWGLLERGDPYWIAVGLLFTAGSFAGYVALFRGVFLRRDAGIGWRESYQITMAGLAATRLFAAGGAGGIALTAWALRKAGMAPREVADGSVSFIALTYVVYMAALVVFGFGLHLHILPGPDPWAFTALPAFIGFAAIAIGAAIALTPTDLQRRVDSLARRQGRRGRLAQRLANVPASASAGIRDALRHVQDRDPALVGAMAFWAFQIATLWAAFHAFGDAPPVAVLVMGFFVGMFGNLLPMPGGVGGVEGGMIASFAAFGVDAGLALVAVLVYRAFAFWLPTIPGAIAYLQLRKTVERWTTERRAPA